MSFAEWWAVYRETYTPLKTARNRDAQIVAHVLPHFGAPSELPVLDQFLPVRRCPFNDEPERTRRELPLQDRQ